MVKHHTERSDLGRRGMSAHHRIVSDKYFTEIIKLRGWYLGVSTLLLEWEKDKQFETGCIPFWLTGPPLTQVQRINPEITGNKVK